MKSIPMRTLFLNEFTKHLILNARKRSIGLMPYHPVKAVSNILPAETGTSQISAFPAREIILPSVSTEIPKSIKKEFEHKISTELKNPAEQIKLASKVQPIIRLQSPYPADANNPNISGIAPVAARFPEGFTLGKIDSIILDRNVTSVDCSGPGKLVLVKSMGITTPTQITLTEQEIREIVETFSKAARIPIVEGIFKAAVGNLVITAVLSDFVGSRFVINKYSPFR